MADVEKLKFTCCGCFKTFVAKSGQCMRTINCPYCGQVNTITTADRQDEIQEFDISKYRPEYYPEACRKAIQQQNEDGFTFP